MLTEKIKKLIYILLIVINLYLVFLIFPKISIVFTTIFNILSPFIIAFILAFILHPLVLFIQKFIKKRILSVGIVMFIIAIMLFFFIKYFANILILELEELSNKLPLLIDQLENIINGLIKKIPFLSEYTVSFDDVINEIISTDKDIVSDVILSNDTINYLFNIGKYLLVIPIILIYFLLDYEKILSRFREYLILNNKIRLKNYLGELNKTMSSYFKGILLVMLILFMVFTIVFIIMKVENGFVFALIIAITNIIPYFGTWIGTTLPVLYVLIYSPQKAIIVLIVCLLIQTLESNFLTPYVQGKQIKIHPLLIMLSLLAFGSIFGFIGLLIAVPLSAVISITLKHYPLKLIKKNIQ